MKKKLLVLLFLGLAAGPGTGQCEWVSVSGALAEPDILTVAVHPKQADLMYAGSAKNVYRSTNGGREWKRVLGLRGEENQVRALFLEPEDPAVVYVATDKGVQKSADAGKKWKSIYRGVGTKAKTVYWVAADPADKAKLLLGTRHGLLRVSSDGQEVKKVESLPELRVYSIEAGQVPHEILLSTDKGVYRSQDSGEHWERVLTDRERRPENPEGTTLSQFEIEELSTGALFSNFVHLSSQNKFLAASDSGLYESDLQAREWKKMDAVSLPVKKVNYLAASEDSFYVATDQGAFQWDKENQTLKDISDGLPSKEVRMMTFHPYSGDLFAATKRGVFRYPKPEFAAALPAIAGTKPGIEDILGKFSHEPTILEIHQAAIRYAEVHPEKIEAWRRAAATKAYLPTVSFSTEEGQDQNVDLDRGGTNDPDRFIIGPKETNRDWHVGLSWDLGDLIWNDDQTSIDTRSKLMVELRDDLLNEVTHLYFERRRLQADMIMNPARELPLQIEKELKLEELTAGIDALTGGYLSKHSSAELRPAKNL